MRTQLCFFILFCCTTLRVWSQPYFDRRQIYIEAQQSIPIQSDKNVTGVVIDGDKELESAFLIVGNDTISLRQDPHALKEYRSGIIHTPTQAQISLFTGRMTESISIILLYSGQSQDIRKSGRLKTGSCEQPEIIEQSDWRSGLPPPDFNRSFAGTDHIIVHHSAGSNTADDYVTEVRNIYIYHTQVNGWSDIGYNYLMAPDGTTFAGRDPGGGEQDLVVGAHFCGKNTGTMGICLLGNYEEVEPSSTSLETLGQLIAWKMKTDNLFPFTEDVHIDGELETLAGHRDGCATLCPGKYLYSQLDKLRFAVGERLESCGQDIPSPFALDLEASDTLIFEDGYVNFSVPDPEAGIRYNWHFEGGRPETAAGSGPISIRYLDSGVFDISLVVGNEFRSDTLLLSDYVRVLDEAARPVLASSVVWGDGPTEVIHAQELSFSSAQVIDSRGSVQVVGVERLSAARSRVVIGSSLDPGIYMLRLKSGHDFFPIRFIKM